METDLMLDLTLVENMNRTRPSLTIAHTFGVDSQRSSPINHVAATERGQNRHFHGTAGASNDETLREACSGHNSSHLTPPSESQHESPAVRCIDLNSHHHATAKPNGVLPVRVLIFY